MLQIQKKLSSSFLALLSLPATAVGFALSTQIAALSWLLQTQYGLDIHDVTLVWLAGPLAGIIAQPIVGAVSDKAWFLGGRRKGFIMIGGVLGALMFLALPKIGIISEALGFSGVLVVATVVALILDLSINVTFNPARAIIADVTPEGEKRTSAYTWMQVISGTFGLLAYFISLLLGNFELMNIAVVVVLICSILPSFFIKEPRNLEDKSENSTNQQVTQKSSTSDVLKTIFPLLGFLLYGFFIIIDKLASLHLDAYYDKFMWFCLILTFVLAVITLIQSKTNPSNSGEFKKIMLAHSFSWVAIQSMFVMTGFFVEKNILPNIDSSNTISGSFVSWLTGKVPTQDQTIGNIISVGFLILNFMGAIIPLILIQPLTKILGRVKTYVACLSVMSLGYLYIYFSPYTEINFYLGMFLAGIGWAAVISLVFSIMSERVDNSKMGLYMGIFNYSVVLPQMMTTGVSSFIKNTENYSYLYLTCGILIAIATFFWLFVKEPESTGKTSSVPSGGGH